MNEKDLNKLRLETGCADPCICKTCGQYYDGYDGIIVVDGKPYCDKCIVTSEYKEHPYFISYRSTFCEGGATNIFTFETAEELYRKIRHRVGKDSILVKDDNVCYLLSQSIKTSSWWALGGVNNFDMCTLNIPMANFDIYNEDNSVNIERRNCWLSGFDLIMEDN